MTGKTSFSFQNVTYTWPDGTRALSDFSAIFPEKRKIAVLGSNGAGKSTLFHLMTGLLKPDQGEIFLLDKKINYSSAGLKELRKSAGLVVQDPDSQLLGATTFQDLAYGPSNLNLPEGEIRKRVNETAALMNLSGILEKPTHFLSYGQKKSVCLAGILTVNPAILILDEPTDFLDPVQKQKVISILDSLSDSEKTIILSSHDMDLVWEWADYLIVLKNGSCEYSGLPDTFFADHDRVHSAGLRQPILIQTWQCLKDTGLVKVQNPPRTIAEFYNCTINSERGVVQ